MIILPRIITGIVGIPLILLCIYYGGGLFIVLLGIVLLYMINEYVRMVNIAGYDVTWFSAFLVGMLIFISVIIEQLKFSQSEVVFTAMVFSFIIFFVVFVEIIKQSPIGAVGRIGVGFIGPTIFAWCLAHLFLIRDLRPQGMQYTFMLFITIWICDTASYIIGTLWGKKKLASNISPKKTVVGLVAGIVAGVFTFVVLKRFFKITQMNINKAMIFGLVISVLTIISDLAESLIKRDCGLKDSDNLLPGHGGIMDRFDSFLFTTPVYYYMLKYFINR